MAIAVYEFPDDDSAEKARSKLRLEHGEMSSAKVYMTVEIYEACEDLEDAGRICRAYGGRPR